MFKSVIHFWVHFCKVWEVLMGWAWMWHTSHAHISLAGTQSHGSTWQQGRLRLYSRGVRSRKRGSQGSGTDWRALQSLPHLVIMFKNVTPCSANVFQNIYQITGNWQCFCTWNVIDIFLKLFNYLFIYFWLSWVFVSVRELSLVAASGGHSSSRCAGLSLSWPLLLWSTGSRRAGSVAVAHGPSCSAACGIFPDQGSNPCPLHCQADSQPLHHQGSPCNRYLINIGGL